MMMKKAGLNKKSVLLDSSSAILLEKSDLLNELLGAYHVLMSEAVYLELTENSYPSAGLFQAICREGNISVQKSIKDNHQVSPKLEGMLLLDLGERETIQQYLDGKGDFIMLDDGKGARFCYKHQIPFINALLFPTILYESGWLSLNQCHRKIERIKQLGRYSQKIITKAEGFSKESLEAFLP